MRIPWVTLTRKRLNVHWLIDLHRNKEKRSYQVNSLVSHWKRSVPRKQRKQNASWKNQTQAQNHLLPINSSHKLRWKVKAKTVFNFFFFSPSLCFFHTQQQRYVLLILSPVLIFLCFLLCFRYGASS